MNSSKRIRISQLSMALAVALSASPVLAQSTSSAIGGQVTNVEGKPVAGATVTIKHIESGTVTTAMTDASGRYSSRGLRVGGPYTITMTKDGVTETRENVYLQLAETKSVDALLGGSKVLDSVQVVGVAGGSDVFSANKMGAGTSIDRQALETLPSVNGNIQDFMRLDPRVAFTDRASGSISAGGQNPRFNKITIDGVSASDTFGLEGNNMPTQRQPVSLAAIEALDISLSNYDVTIAGAAGANVNAVTKSGTNEFHGSVYMDYRDGDWFGDYPARVAGSSVNVTGLPFDEFTDEKTWGFTVGGPIVQDKLFFFVNYEKLKQSNITSAGGGSLGTNPLIAGGDFDAADVAEVQRIARDVWGFDAGDLTGGNTELEEYALKLDWNISDDHRASFRYSKLDQVRVRPEASSASTLSLSSNWYDHEKSVESYVGQLFSRWSDTLTTEFKASYRDYSAIRVNPTTAPTIQVYFDDGVPNGNDNPVGTSPNSFSGLDLIRIGTERSSMGNSLQTETWNYFGSATWTLGDHDVKFGFEYSDNDIYNFFLQDSWGNYSFYVPLVGGVSDFSRLTSGRYFDYDLQTNPTNPDAIAAIYSNRNLGLFVQDTWYVNSNLTLTFGVRADRPSATPDPAFNACFAAAPGDASGAAGCPGGTYTGGFGLDNTNTFPGGFSVQPRFGFNYTFDSERPMQVRGGIGLFQGDAPQVWVGNAYNSTGLNYTSYQNAVCVDTTPVDGLCDNGLQFTADGLNPSIPASGAGVRNVNVIAEDFKLPSVWKANLAFEHELPWSGIIASAELLLTNVKDGIFYRSLNVGPGFEGPDGRTLYWNPNTNNRPFTGARTGRNSYFGDVYLLDNTSQGESQQLTFSLSKPFSAENDWSWTIAYTRTNAEEVASLASSTAGSGYGGQLGFNVNEDVSSTARYEIKDRFSGSLNWKHKFFSDYETRVGLVYEGRSGRPFSYIFSGDANGDNRTFNDLFYVPAGQGDVLFGSLSSTGVFTANPTMEAAFFNWLGTKGELGRYAGTYAPENGFRAGWVNTFDLRISQELPGFFDGHKAEFWIDIQNIGNLINDDWGHVIDYGFNSNQAVATMIGIYQGKYVYGYRSGTEFGQATALGMPTNADGQTNGISQWSLKVGLKYDF